MSDCCTDVLVITSPQVVLQTAQQTVIIGLPAGAGGSGGGTLTGSGAAGQLAVWDGTSDLIGDPALLWDATNKTLSVQTAVPGIAAVAATASGSNANGGLFIANAATAIGVEGDSAAGWGVLGTTGTGRAVLGQAASAGGVALRGDAQDAAAIGLQITQPASPTAAALNGYIDNVLTWAHGLVSSVWRLWTALPLLIQSDGGELGLRMTGDTYGGTNVTVHNRSGENGIILELVPTDLTIALMDLILKHPGGQRNLRLEGRAGDTALGSAQEWQFGTPGGYHTALSDAGLLQRTGPVIGTAGAWFNSAALGTTDTAGFLGLPSCAGPPTGTPAGYPAGVVPLVFDSVGLKLYAWVGGAWVASGVFT